MKTVKMKMTTKSRLNLIIKIYKQKGLNWDFSQPNIAEHIYQFGNKNNIFLGKSTIIRYIDYIQKKVTPKKCDMVKILEPTPNEVVEAFNEINKNDDIKVEQVHKNLIEKYNLTTPPSKIEFSMNGKTYKYKIDYTGAPFSYFVKFDDCWTIQKGDFAGQKILDNRGNLHSQLIIPLDSLYARMLYIMKEKNIVDWIHREGIEFDLKLAIRVVKLIRTTDDYKVNYNKYQKIELKNLTTLEDFNLK
jgi:hypothetical protein